MSVHAQRLDTDTALVAERLCVRGVVQGVGFRPTVWRIAKELGVRGSVCNDGEGVLIDAVGPAALLDAFAHRVQADAPPLSRIASLQRAAQPLPDALPDAFAIGPSRAGTPLAALAPDAAICADCVAELLDPFARRYRYPLTNCTRCGPRLSFVTGLPYDRPRTTMSGFAMCADCRAEYENPADRRFHAQPIACHACGPKVELLRLDGKPFALDAYTFLDACDAAGTLLAKGHVVAIKGLGGYQLACDATDAVAVERLRAAKRRERKPFALMAADVAALAAYVHVDDAERALLESAAAPIVLLELRRGAKPPIAEPVAPGVRTLGFMLPNTGVHRLVLRRMKRPIVLTSGNLSDEPQAITLDELRARFGASGAVAFVLDHARPIARRVDDSVAQVVAGVPRLLRRARGHAPQPLTLPPGFKRAPSVLAYGGALKNTVCLLRDGEALLSAHVGDLEDAATRADWQRALADLRAFYAFDPTLLACDGHPDYASTRQANDDAALRGETPAAVQHHHAHIAACLADHGWPLDAGAVLGVALDGLGWGDDGTLWGGEFLLADYRRSERLGTFKPVALPGGEQAVHEPWRNTYAQLMAEMKWPAFTMNYASLELHAFLAAQPRALLDSMIERGINSPRASSCGRLFDAVAAAIGLCREHAAYEGQGAVELEVLVDAEVLEHEDEALAYPFAIPRLGSGGLPYVEPLAMWQALLGDLVLGTPPATMAARFHKGLAKAIVTMIEQLAERSGVRTVALSGGVWQNRVLFERVQQRLRAGGFDVLSHRQVPCNDGGLALGQAVVAAARALP
jgi:hydrogenase maturation protein HypF